MYFNFNLFDIFVFRFWSIRFVFFEITFPGVLGKEFWSRNFPQPSQYQWWNLSAQGWQRLTKQRIASFWRIQSLKTTLLKFEPQKRCTPVLYSTWSSLVISSTFWIVSEGMSSIRASYSSPCVSRVSLVSCCDLSQWQRSGRFPSKRAWNKQMDSW